MLLTMSSIIQRTLLGAFKKIEFLNAQTFFYIPNIFLNAPNNVLYNTKDIVRSI